MLSHLNYCIVVWGNSSHTKLDSLFKLQKKALRICLGCHYLAHSAPLFTKLKTLNIFDLYYYSMALLGFYYFQNKLPNNISEMFIINNKLHNYNTRNRDSFHLWSVRTNIAFKSARNSFPIVWNSIPRDISTCKNLSSFQRYLKQYLIFKYQ